MTFPDANPTPPPALPEGDDSRDSQFPHAEDDFGLAPTPKPSPQAKSQRVDPLLGLDLGGVTIVRLIGEGGMGRVYEAQQANPSRPVAVKVIRQGITSEKTMRRFEREAEFLGKLQHPGIAQIYVVGSYTSDSGDVPFFVMEFIAHAKPINNFASEQELPIRDRLRLFKRVCEAVSHGHDRGIIHRDLKPGNILIDSDGAPKVIDFGVARSTDSDLTLTSMKTDTGQLVGTVQYMSPEQFGDSAEDLDGRADVYSLGVVLYELIAGVLPYEVRRKKMHEAARIVCEYVPAPLRSHDKAIPREVSLIAERCLQKNRRDRYQTAGALADDIQRFLDGRPIRRSYRGWLARLRRHANTRAAKVGLGVALVLTGVLATILLDRLGRTKAGVESVTTPPGTPTDVSRPMQPAIQPPIQPPIHPSPVSPPQGKPWRVSDSGLLVNPDIPLRGVEQGSLRQQLLTLVDENLAAMTAQDLPRLLATMSREMPQRELFIEQCRNVWAEGGMHHRLDGLEVVDRPDWPPPYAVARVTVTIRDPTRGHPPVPGPDGSADGDQPEDLAHAMLLRTKTPTTVSEWLFKREAMGWKIVANLTAPESATPPGEERSR